jgi:hypothetical protein
MLARPWLQVASGGEPRISAIAANILNESRTAVIHVEFLTWSYHLVTCRAIFVWNVAQGLELRRNFDTKKKEDEMGRSYSTNGEKRNE